MNPPIGTVRGQQTHETHETSLPEGSPFTQPGQIYVPGQHSYSPYPEGSPLKNLDSFLGFSASAPPTPVKGLSTQEVENMSKVWNSPAKLVEVIAAAISVYTGLNTDECQVTDILKRLLEFAVSALRVL